MPFDPRVNILLVDDRPENLITLESVLEGLGQNLVKAASGREALKQVLADEFAVILLDVQMPEMDGFETAALIRSREKSRHTPIIFLTAISRTEEQAFRGYSVGAVDYIFKPFVPEVLQAKVAAFIGLFQNEQRLKQAEEKVRKLNEELERRVRERTAELEDANQELQNEIAERRRAEEERARLLAREQTARAEAEAAQQRLIFLSDASATLAGSLDYEITLERVARLTVPHLADYCIVDLVGEDGQIRRVATAHAVREKEELLRQLQDRFAPDWDSPQVAARVLRSGEPEIVPEVDDAWLIGASRDAEHLQILRALGPVSYMVIPLVARGHTVGAISFAAAESARQYGPGDLTLAEDLGRRASAAIDNARLFQEIQAAGRRKDEFLAMLSHELRNPLAAVCNASFLLEKITPADTRTSHLGTVISRQTQHLCRIVDDLLDISRITRGTIELRKEAVDLALAVEHAVETTRPLLEAREHELSVSLPPEPVRLEADPTRLEQVLTNLLNNAAKYTKTGGRIWVTAVREGADVVIRVRDSGVGISPELLPNVFDLFAQADRSLDRADGGLGIGLALVRGLVQMHGGSVAASSEGLDRGSEFVVRLPAMPAAPPVREASPAPEVSSAARGAKVLIVDDNVDAAESLAELLGLWGHDVCTAHNGAAALQSAARCTPEVVLLDIGLPGMDGYEVARQLRQQASLSATRLIALTGYGQDEDRCRSEEAGFCFHLTKPVDPEKLQQLLATLPASDPVH
jgi:signal transduction histidine kinase/DNA-binding response OmpR family regulator